VVFIFNIVASHPSAEGCDATMLNIKTTAGIIKLTMKSAAILITDWVEQDEVISGCIQSNRRCQELLYKQFYGPMMALCIRYTKNEEDALEVLHNGFLKVYKHIATYDAAKASLYTWIKTIVVNSAIDFIRSNQKFKNKVELKPVHEIGIDNTAISRLSAAELLELVRSLPQATQTVFNLYVIEGYNHREIGELLGISEGTSKWHLSEARRQLKQLLLTMHVEK
ncbi:MAG: sigma-70 family RNA polymerase sigma factor, partial [Flavihumibacter sp.]|nr:sigma-70 family RNA polymerase sigma factor [Flavihumibacter sp.]